MTQKVSNTIRNFISSNNAFCDALKNNQIYIDDNILFELILYYLKLNKDLLHMIEEQDRNVIAEIIFDQNYTIEGNILIINDRTISLSYLKKIVLEIEDQLKHKLQRRIMYFQDVSTKEFKLKATHYHPSTKLKVIPFEESKKNTYYINLEKEREYEQTTKIDNKTRPYIKESRENFVALVSDIVHKALTNSLDNYPIKYLKVIASYLQIYPFTTYLVNKKHIPYEVLTIDHSKIGIRKTTYDNHAINRLKRELANLLRYQQQLEYEEEKAIHDENVKSHQLTITEQTIINIDKTKLRIMLEIYELENSPIIYNKNLLENIAASFENGTISINRFFANPLLRIFLADNDQTYFHCALHLETLFTLIDSNQLLSEIENKKILRLPQ